MGSILKICKYIIHLQVCRKVDYHCLTECHLPKIPSSKIHKGSLSNLCYLLENHVILDSLIKTITSKSIFALCKRYSSSSLFLGKRTSGNMKTQSVFLWFKLLRLWIPSNVIIFTVKDSFGVFIWLRRKMIKFSDKVT